MFLLAALLVLGFVLRNFEQNQVYHPSREFRSTGRELGRHFEEATFKAEDGVSLHGWFFPADTNAARVQMAALICHGNAGNIGDRLEIVEAYLRAGLNVLVFDYRGYGRSGGRPSEAGTYQDAEAAMQWLQGKGFAPGNVLLHGESLGGGVASEIAVRQPVAGLILQSTFTSIPDIGAELFPWLPVRLISRIRYDTQSKLGKVRVPVMVMHSRSDSLIRYHHAEKNFAAANEPKLLWELKGDHNNYLDEVEQFVEGVERFLKMVRPASAMQADEEKTTAP